MRRVVVGRLLQVSDLFLQPLEPLGLMSVETSVFLTPALEGLLADPEFLADLRGRLFLGQLNLRLSELIHDLLDGVAVPCHSGPALPIQS